MVIKAVSVPKSPMIAPGLKEKYDISTKGCFHNVFQFIQSKTMCCLSVMILGARNWVYITLSIGANGFQDE